jgi:N-acetyl-anhydromuramyl-L-alanine amidase AmpD
MVDYAKAISMLVNEQRVFINQNTPKWVVLHKTAGMTTVQELGNYFATTSLMTSSHYGVGLDGSVAQYVLEKDGAAGNCCTEVGHATFLPDAPGSSGINLNMCTISIEHLDPATDNSSPVTSQQQQASFDLIVDICKRHNIPMREGDSTGGIITHAQIDPVSRSRCPGNYPLSELWSYLQNMTQTTKTRDVVCLGGETLETIAHYVFGNSQAVQELEVLNKGTTVSTVFTKGQVIHVPVVTTPVTVTTGNSDTLAKLAHYGYGTSADMMIQKLLSQNPSVLPAIGAAPLPANLKIIL